MSLAEELTRITAALRKMDPEALFDEDRAPISRDEVARLLEEACGFAPAELVDWCMWLKNEYPREYFIAENRTPFQIWNVTSQNGSPLDVTPLYASPEESYVEILSHPQGGFCIYAHVVPDSETVAVAIGFADEFPRELSQNLESYVALWRELLEDHAVWSENRPFWNIRSDVDHAVSIMHRVGI